MLLSHLYKNTALLAVAAFIVMGIGLTSHHSELPASANTPTSTITVTAGTGTDKTWKANGVFSQTSSSGTNVYGFNSGNNSFLATSATMPSAKNNKTTQRGWFANTATNTLYGRISSVSLTQTANVAMVGYFNTSAITNIDTPSGTSLSAVVTGTGPYIHTWTPSAGANYQYFFLRNGGSVANAAVSQIVISFVPILSSIAITTPAPRRFLM
ncbi:MAG: hypothetical protein NTV44_05280 [Firmicutes bacterium]|nr:hypothetical protein [Bacillota bacterium]